LSPRLDSIGGLSVYVYFADHRRPHVQVRGPGVRANVDIRTGDVLAGHLGPKQLRTVHTWLTPRRDALEAAFFAALRHEQPDTIISGYREATDDL
jgi:hypothetical protein